MCPLFPHVRPLCILPRFILESVLPDQENGSGGHLTPAARAWLPEGLDKCLNKNELYMIQLLTKKNERTE